MSDFVVVGGGIAGVSVGARLSHLGEVALIEAESSLAYHASGRSAALFEETYGLPPTLALNSASRDYHMTANGGVLGLRGLLLVGTDDDEDVFERDLAAMRMDLLTTQEACALVPLLNPEVVTRAGHRRDAWDIDTDRLMGNFVREIRRNGGSVVTGAPVDRILRDETGWTIVAGGEERRARVLVNAAGAWADQMACLAGIEPLGLTPLRRSVARLPVPGGHDPSGWPVLFGVGESWYAKPDAGMLIVSPADEDPEEPHDAWADDLVVAEGIARFEAVSTEPVARVAGTWAGLRTFAPDRNLVIGFDPRDSAFFWQAGLGGYGFQTAPAASRLAADIISGKSPELEPDVVRALSPARFASR